MNQNEFEDANQRMWDELAPVHYKSYGLDRLRKGETLLDNIQLAEVGEVRGKSLLHLQCHIGSDTLSWALRGAEVVGVDFSGQSIEFARRLADELKLKAEFVHSNIYDIEKHLNRQFDIVYTSQGVLCWLKDIKEWARLIARYLKPGGLFYIMESHPIQNVFNNIKSGPLEIIYPYFHREQPTKWDDNKPDYSDSTFIYNKPSYEWIWTLSDIVNSLISAGLIIESLNEYDKAFDQIFPDMVKDSDGWWYHPDYRGKLPLIFTLRAIKK
jgi:SAM-dependent methyltransferase